MAKKSTKRASTGRVECTPADGKRRLADYFKALPKLESEEKERNGKPGGYLDLDEFLYGYLVPMGLNRLAALDRYNAKK